MSKRQSPSKSPRRADPAACEFRHLSVEEYKAAMGDDAKGADKLIPCPRCGTLCGGVELLVSIIPEGASAAYAKRVAPDVLDKTVSETLPDSPF